MDSKPLVSVVMPVYGVEKYIENSVKSVINQTYDNIELILVDDGSTDRSTEIAERVLNENQFTYSLIRQENAGLGYARNTGLKHSTGEWIIFFDSDDVILPETIERLVESLDDKADLVFSDFRYVSQTDEIEAIQRGKTVSDSPEGLQKDFLLRKRRILASGTMIKREVLINNQLFFSKIPWSEDQHFLWRLLSYIGGAVYVDEPLYLYLKRDGSIMSASKAEKIIQSYPAICELPKYYENNQLISEFLVARWVMGTLNAAARITDYINWIKLFQQLDGVYNLKTLLRFPLIKVKLAAFLCLISKKLYYSRINPSD